MGLNVEKDKEINDIEAAPVKLEEVNNNVLKLTELAEIFKGAFTNFTDMKAKQSENQLKQHQISDKTARYMYTGDRMILVLLLVLIAVGTFFNKIPEDMFWTVLLIGVGYFIKDSFQSIMKSKAQE